MKKIIYFSLILFLSGCGGGESIINRYEGTGWEDAYFEFSIPEEMIVGNSYSYELAIQLTPQKSNITPIIKIGPVGGKEYIENDFIDEHNELINFKVKNIANIELIVDKEYFEKTQLTGNIKELDSLNEIHWTWLIKPKKSGVSKIYAIVNSYDKDELSEAKKNSYTPLKIVSTINIESELTSEIKLFFFKNWKWLTTVIFIPFFIWLKRKNKKKKKKNPIGFQ